jgi:uncharacterized protein (DUF608 family)
VTAGLAAWQSGLNAIAGPFDTKDVIDHFVPIDKKLAQSWVDELFAVGSPRWYSGAELTTIGMPVGGICAGQVYLTGDGRLIYWDIFNQTIDTGAGQVNYKRGRKPKEIASGTSFLEAPLLRQGTALRVQLGDNTEVRTLEAQDFTEVRFCGEYPLGLVEYRDSQLPIEIKLAAFSPFVPLNAVDSALPATILSYTIRNTSAVRAEVSLLSWLENATLLQRAEQWIGRAKRHNRAFHHDLLSAVVGTVKATQHAGKPSRAPIVFADFEADGYGNWTAEGKAFGSKPAVGTLPFQQPVGGFQGQSLVNSFAGGDDPHGKLISPVFKIERPWIGFLIGGGNNSTKACINLVVEGQIVRTATGKNGESLEPHNWNVAEWVGKEARIEIVDEASGPWGHINVDQIEFRDEPLAEDVPFEKLPDFGSMAIAVLGGPNGSALAALPDEMDVNSWFTLEPATASAEYRLDEVLLGGVRKSVSLSAGEETTISFVIGWHMPNKYREQTWVGNYYGKQFSDAGAVVRYVADNFQRLSDQTRLWHDVYYDSTLPRWLLDRVGMTLSNLATGTCQWWRNGRFWAWEGVGCCHGTCGHVWNYEHASARLFPELARSVRTMQDFAPGVGFDANTGAIGFRGEGWTLWAGDSQGGYILKAYREHQCSVNDEFLRGNWKNILKAVEFLIKQDVNSDGLIEGRQHQTYDQDYYGANTFVGSLYLGALRAAEEMAREVGDNEFAAQCRQVFAAGRDNSTKQLFNGEYFIQDVDLAKHPDWQYADGCLADQLFGQNWAHQVGLGYLYPQETVVKSLTSIWKYCWAPDIRLQNEKHHPERWFAMPGEAGLFTCTWPKSKHLGEKSTRYRDEIWTGIEYQVASHMAWEGMLTEALAICRAIDERYHPAKRNPFNEIECGDHYARSMASWGMLTALAGFEYHGPRKHIGFAPRITPESFQSVFTVAEGWGSYSQHITDRSLSASIAVRWGQLDIGSVTLSLPKDQQLASVELKVAGVTRPATFAQSERRVTLELAQDIHLEQSEALDVVLWFA